MNIKKPLLVLGAVTGIGLAGAAGLGVASAATPSNGQDGIIDKLAARFNLNKEEVAQVFEEERAEREAERQQRAEERLTQAVKDGKLTEEQKAKILVKLEELRTAREEWKSKAPEDRREAKTGLHEELTQWATDNDVPLEYFKVIHHRGNSVGMHLKIE